ncbi:MAG: hypothetical protein MZV64_31900, partial [Ignavibacteriales bacterium]|nr:hypothetical protein [Ignavibacteriales bacterium]
YFVQLRITKVNTKTPTTFFSTSPSLENVSRKLEQVVTNLVLNAIHALAARDGGRLAPRSSAEGDRFRSHRGGGQRNRHGP